MNLNNTFGSMFIGVVVAAVLYGVSCVQTWFYYNRYPKDPISLKLLVAAAFGFDTVHQALITHCAYTYLVTNFDNPIMLTNLVWSLFVEVLFNGFTALLVQSFLSWRVWKLSNKNFFFTGLVMLFVLAEFGCVVVYTIKALRMTTFAELTQLKALSESVNILAMVGDILIAIMLCTLLQKSRTGFSRSDSMITKLMIFTVNTGLLTFLCATASLISILASPNTFIYIAFYFTLGRLYNNSLLATLNARQMIRGGGADDQEVSLSLQGMTKNNTTRGPMNHTASRNNNISIKIDTTKEFVSDGDLSERESLPYSGKADAV